MDQDSIVFVSDLHLGTPAAGEALPDFAPNWQQAAATIRRLDPQLVLLGGDLTRDGVTRPQDYQLVRDRLDALQLPWLAVPGNHEVGNKFHPQGTSSIHTEAIERYRRQIGADYWERYTAGLRIIGINSFLPGSGLAEEGPFWDWLEQLRPDTHNPETVLISHMPLWLASSTEPTYDRASQHDSWYSTYDPPQRERLLAVCHKLGVSWVLSGHVHCHHQQSFGNIQLLSAPAVAWGIPVQQWPAGDIQTGLLHGKRTPSGLVFERLPL